MDATHRLPFDEHGLTTRERALAAGVDVRAIRTLRRQRGIVTVRRGVYADAQHWDRLDPFTAKPLLRIRAARLTLQAPHVLSHDSAALLLGLPLADPRRSLVHVTRRKVHGDAVRAGVKHHLAPYDDAQVLQVGGLPVLEAARTALDVARESGLAAGLACCDAALRSGVTRGELAEARAAMWCWPGSTVMDAALSLADPGAETWLESAARLVLHGLGVGRPQTQFGLTDGRRTVWCDLRIGRHIFEVDGIGKYVADPAGRDSLALLREEKKRQDFITGFKLGVSRITHADLTGSRSQLVRRLRREYDDTCRRFGTAIDDLAQFRPREPRGAA